MGGTAPSRTEPAGWEVRSVVFLERGLCGGLGRGCGDDGRGGWRGGVAALVSLVRWGVISSWIVGEAMGMGPGWGKVRFSVNGSAGQCFM